MEALIPALPDEVAAECLLRVSYSHLTILGSVCQQWRRWIHSPDFHRRRCLAGISRPLLAFTQYSPFTVRDIYTTVKNLTIFDPTSGKWHCLPSRPTDVPIPWIYDPHLAGLGHHIVAITWCNDVSYVHSYNLLTGRWCCRAPMPGPPRTNFTAFLMECAESFMRTGGNTKKDDSLQSGMIFDLEKDTWESLPDLTDGLLQFELLTMASRYWTVMDLRGKYFNMPPSLSSALELQGKVYHCEGRKLSVRNGSTWQPILDLPQDVNHLVYLTISKDGQLVMSSVGHPKLHTLILKGDSRSLAWMAHKVPTEYRGNLHDACWLEI